MKSIKQDHERKVVKAVCKETSSQDAISKQNKPNGEKRKEKRKNTNVGKEPAV